ncbi:MAG: hypothetical protein QXG05_05800 [Nitrososphaerota archaeon]
MERIKIFLVMLITASIGLGISIVAISVASQKTQDVLSIILELISGQAPSDTPFFVPLSFMLFFSTTLASTIGAIYFLVLPEIKNKQVSDAGSIQEIVAVMKFLLPDEKQVVELLMKHEGACLQKDISKESGFSRLKTHRIIVRLAERGIVLTERYGNTNIVKLVTINETKK